MRLARHLPDFVSNIREFQEIDKTHTYELDKLDYRLKEILDNQFVDTASLEGLSRYEKMLGIREDCDVDIRRFNILSKYNSSIPFSMRWLQNTLNTTLGQGSYLIDLENKKFTLTISVMKAKEYLIDNLRKELSKKIPANLILIINVLSPIEVPLNVGVYIRTGDKLEL